jgi:hypothetical protein
VIVWCRRRGASLDSEPSLLESAPPTAKTESSTPAKTTEPSVLCAPGSTQACVGVGACQGGQACLSDGSGFGPCECAPSHKPSTPTLETSPEAGPAPTTPAPSAPKQGSNPGNVPDRGPAASTESEPAEGK